MTKFKDTWTYQFLTSSVFISFLLFVSLIVSGIIIGNCRENNKQVIHMQEDVLYIKPKSDTVIKK